MALSDQDLIGVRFEYVHGHFLEVTGVHPKLPGAILYRDLTTEAEGTMLSLIVRRAKQREHLENLVGLGLGLTAGSCLGYGLVVLVDIMI